MSHHVIVDFEKYYQCSPQEIPNVAAIDWIKSSDKLLILAQVPPHSSCNKMGMIKIYEISIPSGHILRSYNENALPKYWRSRIVLPH